MSLEKRTEEARRRFALKGCTMTGKYVNNSTPVEYMCKCGKQGLFARLNAVGLPKWSGCRDCVNLQTKKTNFEIYGVSCVLKNPEIKQKANRTMLEKYDAINPMQSSSLKKKKLETEKTQKVETPQKYEDTLEKRRKTNFERHGVTCVLNLQENLEKAPSASKAKFGEKGPLGNIECRKKRDETMEKIYGDKHALRCEKLKEKAVETTMRNHGVRHHAQSEKIYSKILSSAFKTKEFIFPSGKVVPYQGYEHYAILLLLEEGHEEEDIVSCHESVMGFMYEDGETKRKYYPDLFVPSSNLVVEVKSTWTYEKTPEEKQRVLKKLEACRREGYNTRLLVFSPKGEILLDEKKTKDE